MQTLMDAVIFSVGVTTVLEPRGPHSGVEDMVGPQAQVQELGPKALVTESRPATTLEEVP